MRTASKVLIVLAAIPAVLAAALAAFIAFGPVKISNMSILLNAITGSGIDAPEPSVWQQRLQVPEGFSLSMYAADLPMARFMAFTDAGDLLVSRPRAGEIVLLGRDANGDHLPDTRRVLLKGLSRPHGLAVHDGWLYVAEGSAIGRSAFDVQRGELVGEYEYVVEDLPDGGNHWSKTIGFGPDGYLYVAIGSTCNVCVEDDPRRAAIMRFAADGSDGRIYATGLRNTVGFDWAPWSGDLYGTDNGRDLLGDDYPPCELNRIVDGGFYGWPYINGFAELDPDLGQGQEAQLTNAISPVYGFAAHNAPLGMAFANDAAGFAPRSALVALHGSWNRSIADGYKVVLLEWQPDGTVSGEDFLYGFERDGDVIGRPVDVVQGSDGAMYVSDDYAGVIYRVAYGEEDAVVQQAAAVKVQAGDPLQGIATKERDMLAVQGKALYRELGCSTCHGGDQHGALALQSLGSKYDWRGVVSMLDTPTPPMPRFDLTAQQQQALAVYLLQRKP